MYKRKRWLLVVSPIVLVLLLTVFAFSVARAEYPPTGDDVRGYLTGLEFTVIQDGSTIDPGGDVDSEKPISVKVSFNVPVAGDDPTPTDPVKHGDYAGFELSDAFALVGNTEIPLDFGDITVGTVYFRTEGGKVIATVVFDGDEEVFDEDGGYNSVECEFGATLEYDSSGDSPDGGTKQVEIVEKTFNLRIPEASVTYTVTKAGAVDMDDKNVAWTVTISAAATRGGKSVTAPIPLEGYQFVDDLTGVGDYITGSFTVGGSTPDPGPSYVNKVLSYTFPDGVNAPQTVRFKTEIPDGKYYSSGGGQQSISNTAQLKDGDEILKTGSRTVSFTPLSWISKSGAQSDTGLGGYDPSDQTITWSIVVNEAGRSLEDVVITDVLAEGLTWQSAKWEIWDGSVWVAPAGGGDFSSQPAQGKYNIGDINNRIRLTIVAKVPSPGDDGYQVGVVNYLNSATVTWTGSPDEGHSASTTVGVGYSPIRKVGSLDQETATITWTVSVGPRGQNIPDPTVYDLIVYGATIDEESVTGLPSGITIGGPNGLTPRGNQMYVDGSFDGSGLTLEVIAIMDGPTRVADLLVVTGFPTTGEGAANWTNFTFETLVLDPDIFAGNSSESVTNTATLFSGTTYLSAVTGTVTYSSNVLAKEMLVRGYGSDPAAGVNDYTSSPNLGFDYIDKSVIFRLGVNADGMDLTNMWIDSSGSKLGPVILTDTLPDGWEFVEIVTGSMYQVFKGTQSGDTVDASGSPPVPLEDVSAFLSAVFSGTTATFTFSALNEPYVILVKARPTEATLEEYFGKNQTLTEANDVTLYTLNWTPGVSESQNVTIKSVLLDKKSALVEAGVVRWTVEYRAYDLDWIGTAQVQDTLPAGLDVRTDATGALDLSGGNITAQEMELQPDGTYALFGSPLDVSDPSVGVNPSYDTVGRILTLNIPDATKAYRFTYVTDVTGEPGTVTNRAMLCGEEGEQEETSDSYQITQEDGSASLKKNGWIEITKLGDSDGSLPGVTFSVLALDGVTVIRTGISGADGKLRLKVIPDGSYILREVSTPSGYDPERVDRALTVTTQGSIVTVAIDGNPGNSLTVHNYREGTAGDLTISKVVAGNAADTSKQFDFTVVLTFPEDFSGDPTASYTYVGTGVPGGSISSGDTIALAHGQSITIVGLPKDTTYAVIEADYSADDYSTIATGDIGTIVADEAQVAAFVNTRNEGDLTIVKTVGGNAANLTKPFRFTVTFTGDQDVEHAYVGNGVPDGTLKSGGTVSLAHGQSITFTGLPEGLGYTVTEADYSSDGYVTTAKGSTGAIAAETVRTAAFRNVSNVAPEPVKTGALTITKTVEGSSGDMDRQFTFMVVLNVAGSYSYSGSKAGTISNGQIVTLSHGEYITIRGLPRGATYQVTEVEADGDGYVTSATGAAGAITEAGRTATFVNAKSTTTTTEDNGTTTTTTTDTGDTTTTTTEAEETTTSTTEDGGATLPTSTGGGGTTTPSTGGSGSTTPKTGDNDWRAIWAVGLFGCLLLLGALVSLRVGLRGRK
ncbi:MAG: hypothetical protein GX113_00560 [Actinobacteria bacterium]|nr:hypothetical protein [Actinomycetota bacterium]